MRFRISSGRWLGVAMKASPFYRIVPVPISVVIRMDIVHFGWRRACVPRACLIKQIRKHTGFAARQTVKIFKYRCTRETYTCTHSVRCTYGRNIIFDDAARRTRTIQYSMNARKVSIFVAPRDDFSRRLPAANCYKVLDMDSGEA